MRMVRLVMASALLVALAACDNSGIEQTRGNATTANQSVTETGGDQSVQTIPAQYLGTWDASADACAGQGGEMRLTISPDSLRFYEGSATVRSVEPSGKGVLVAATLDSEGMTEERQYRMSLAGEKLRVTTDDATAQRVRCGG